MAEHGHMRIMGTGCSYNSAGPENIYPNREARALGKGNELQFLFGGRGRSSENKMIMLTALLMKARIR